MKRLIFGMMMVVSFHAVLAEDEQAPVGQLLRAFPWPKTELADYGKGYPPPPYTTIMPGPLATVTLVKMEDRDNPYALKITYSGKEPYDIWLLYLEAAMLTNVETRNYGITGKAKHDQTAPYYFELVTEKASTTPGYGASRYLARSESNSEANGSDWSDFALEVHQQNPSGGMLGHLHVSLHMTGPGTVYVQTLNLMQYPDGPLPSPATNSTSTPDSAPTPASLANLQAVYDQELARLSKLQNAMQNAPVQSTGDPAAIAISIDIEKKLKSLEKLKTEIDAQRQQLEAAARRPAPIDWKSFLLGVLATGMALLTTTGLVFLWQRIHRGRHERELRRMASLDS